VRNLGSIWGIVVRRSATNWRMLAVLALGVLVAATLLASAPIYARTMADLGLTFTIREELRQTPNIRVEFQDLALGTREGTAFRSALDQRIDERIGWLRKSQSLSLRAGRFTIEGDNEPESALPPLGQLQSLTNYEDHVRVVEGRLPEPTPPGEAIEVTLSIRGAEVAGLRPGDRFLLKEDFDTCEREIPSLDRPPPPPCTPVAAVIFTIPAVLAGIVEPLDPADVFWLSAADGYFAPSVLVSEMGPILPMFTAEETLLENVGALYPSYRAFTSWHVFVDPEVLTRTNFERARADIVGLGDDVVPLRGFAYSPLTQTLEGFRRSANYQQGPLMILLLQIAAIALFYVGLVSAIIVERQADEIALLRSRGASVRQVLTVYLLEGAIVGAPMVLIAPLMAAAATALLGLTPVFTDVSGGALLPVTIPPLSFLLAGGGVLLSLAALLLPAFVVARRGAMAQRRRDARPGVSIIQRYYLDLVLAGFAGLLLWELGERGSAFEPSPTGGVTTDPILLAAPALIILAAAALILRFYPIVLRFGALFFTPRSGATVAIGLWQVVRSPGQYTRLTLLLMMAIAVVTYAASYSTTAKRSYQDRADFRAGVDVRAQEAGSIGFRGTTAEIDDHLGEIPGVARASMVVRGRATLAAAGTSSRDAQVLGIDPTQASQMLWSREDFSSGSLSDLLAPLDGPRQTRGVPLPGNPDFISLWVNTVEPRSDMNLWARVRDAEDRHALLEFGSLEEPGWRELRAPVKAQFGPQLTAPITVVAIVITEPANRFNTSTAPLYVDDLGAVDSAGNVTVIEAFEGGLPWSALPSRAPVTDTFETSPDDVHAGRQSGKLSFRLGLSGELRGIYPQDVTVPLPIVVSDSFVASTGYVVGARLLLQSGTTLIPVIVRDTFSLFPTLESRQGPAVIFNRDQLVSWVNAFSFGARNPLQPREAWFTLEPGADRDAFLQAITGPGYGMGSITDREREFERIEQNPLIAAGGSGILFVAFLGVLLLVGAALLVSLWVAVNRRRIEFAILRAMGISRGQIFRTLALEYALVAIVGVVAGTYLGLVVGRQMLSFLDVTETGERVEPSFVLQTAWAVVAGGAGVVAMVFVVALLVAVRVLARTSDAQALRTE